MKGMRWLAIVAVSMLACTRQQAPRRTAPSPETLVTIDDLRRRLQADSLELIIIDGVPIPRPMLDTLPPAEVVSAQVIAFRYDCRPRGRDDYCRVVIVERCGDGARRSRRSHPECPWVVAQPWDDRVRSQ
jgi:hypothetical protein